MKKILFIAPYNLNKRKGGALAALAYYNALKTLYGERLDLMMPKEAAVGIFRVAIKVPSRPLVKALLSGSLHRYKAFVKRHLLSNKGIYDMCIINGSLYAGDMMDFIHELGLKIIVIHHNFEREYAMDNKSLLTLGGITPFFVVKNEKSAYKKADVNCFLTKEDMQLFRNHYGDSKAKVHLLGVFEHNNQELPPFDGNVQKIITITGSMDSVQTICGIKDIHKNYYDIIKEYCPEWLLVIAGRNPHHEVYNLQNDNPEHIKVVPNPVVMDDITRNASIFLCPTNVGGGLKLRVMDGLRMGLPVLVHKVSSRGYNVLYDKPYFKIYDNRESFAQGLKELLQYCERDFDRNQIRQDYLDTFSFASGCKRMERAVDLLRD